MGEENTGKENPRARFKGKLYAKGSLYGHPTLLGWYVSQLIIRKYQTHKDKGSFWLVFIDIPVQDELPPLLLALSEPSTLWWTHVIDYTTHHEPGERKTYCRSHVPPWWHTINNLGTFW